MIASLQESRRNRELFDRFYANDARVGFEDIFHAGVPESAETSNRGGVAGGERGADGCREVFGRRHDVRLVGHMDGAPGVEALKIEIAMAQIIAPKDE